MKLSNLFEFDVLVANNVSDGNESMDTIRVFPEKVKEIFYINVNVISFLRAILISGGIFF